MLIALLMLQAAPIDDQMRRGQIVNLVWQSCVEVTAKNFASGNDSATDIAVAALYQCRPAEEDYRKQFETILSKHPDVRPSAVPNYAKSATRERAEELRAAAIAAVISARAAKKRPPH